MTGFWPKTAVEGIGAVAGGIWCDLDRGTLVAEEAAPGGSMSPVGLGDLIVVALTTSAVISGSDLTVSTSTGFEGSGTVAGTVSGVGATEGASAVLATEVADDVAILALR